MEITQEEYDQLVAKAKEDKLFQQELLDKPIETIESFTGKKLDLDEIELKEADLEKVAGGVLSAVCPLVMKLIAKDLEDGNNNTNGNQS